MNPSASPRPGKLVPLFPILISTLFWVLIACDDPSALNTNKQTYTDDIADITFLNGAFYTTNYDLSGNAGSQIDLMRFEGDSVSTHLDDHFDLDMNGQGYLAICSDGTDIYLQSRATDLIIKCSSVGEKAFTRYDEIQSHWHPAGISYDINKDSLLVLYRNSQQVENYRLRTIDPELEGPASADQAFSLDLAGTGYYGVYALAVHSSGFYMLGVDTSATDILITANRELTIFQQEIISDSTVVGLCFREDELFLSYRDRRIEYWASY